MGVIMNIYNEENERKLVKKGSLTLDGVTAKPIKFFSPEMTPPNADTPPGRNLAAIDHEAFLMALNNGSMPVNPREQMEMELKGMIRTKAVLQADDTPQDTQ